MKLKLSKQTSEEKDYSEKSSKFLIPMSQGGSMIQPRKFLPNHQNKSNLISPNNNFDMSKLPTANILREVEVTAKRPVRPVAVKDQTPLVNLQQMDEFEVVANRINRPQAAIEKPKSNALHNDYRYGPEAVGISNRKIIEAFKPEYDAELKMTNDSTEAFNNMLENRQINAPRASTKTDKNLYSPELIRRALINRSHKYRPL